MKIIKFIINFLLAFLLLILIYACIALNAVKDKVLNKEYIYSKINEIKFYDQVSSEIKDGFDNYKYQSGLPEETLDNLYSKDVLIADVNSVINHIYDGTEITNHSEDVKEELNKRIYDYVSSKKIKLNEQGKQNISNYEDYIVIEYVNNAGISSTLVSILKSALSKLTNIVDKISNYPIIILVITVLIIIIINIKNLLKAINWIGISLLCSGSLLALTSFWINRNFQLTNITIFKKSATSLIVGIIQEILYNFQDTAKLLVFCGIIAILSSCILNNIDIKKKNDSQN